MSCKLDIIAIDDSSGACRAVMNVDVILSL